MRASCDKHGGEEKFVQGSGGKTCRKESAWKGKWQRAREGSVLYLSVSNITERLCEMNKIRVQNFDGAIRMENQSTRRKMSSHCHFVSVSPILVGLGANPNLCGEKPLANRLKQSRVRLEELDVDGGVNVLFRLTICSGLPRIVPAFRPVCQFAPVGTKEAKIKRNENETKGI